MPDTLARARELAAQLVGAGVPAVADVRDATANLPCILIPPPRLDFDLHVGATTTWGLVALAATNAGAADAWAQLVTLVDGAAALLPIETAAPTSYQLPTGGDPLPAYVLTFTESL